MKNNSRSYISLIIIAGCFLVAVVFFSCNGGNATDQMGETPTTGNIRISIDESFKLLFDTQLYTFHTFYTNAHITPSYKPEVEVVNDFLNDSVRTIVSTYKISQEEIDNLLVKRIVVRTEKIAYDALALIINPDNTDSLLFSSDIKKIFKGQITSWNEINVRNKSGNINVVFDNIKSANVRYFKEKFNLSDTLPSNFMSARSNEEVINYVKSHRGAIGILSSNWISDKRDTVSEKFLSEIRVVAITPEFDPEGNRYFKPYQAYIADKSYPYTREVYMHCRETFTGLGMGFIKFVSGEKGQRIILKSKLVPAVMPVRIVGFR
jgi:phosphate transport system substrate-binding protein